MKTSESQFDEEQQPGARKWFRITMTVSLVLFLGFCWWTVAEFGAANETARRAVAVGETMQDGVGEEYRELVDGIDKGELGEDAALGARDVGSAAKKAVVDKLKAWGADSPENEAKIESLMQCDSCRSMWESKGEGDPTEKTCPSCLSGEVSRYCDDQPGKLTLKNGNGLICSSCNTVVVGMDVDDCPSCGSEALVRVIDDETEAQLARNFPDIPFDHLLKLKVFCEEKGLDIFDSAAKTMTKCVGGEVGFVEQHGAERIWHVNDVDGKKRVEFCEHRKQVYVENLRCSNCPTLWNPAHFGGMRYCPACHARPK